MSKARFWICHPSGGVVRIKLYPGQTIHHYFCQSTDEGWNSEAVIFHYDGAVVTSEFTCDGQGCDGRLTRFSRSFCDYVSLKAGYFDRESNVVFPAWEHEDSSQRDYSAEAMGY